MNSSVRMNVAALPAVKLAIHVLTICLAACTVAKADESVLDVQIKQAYEAGKLDGLHGVMVVHNGEVLAETYFPGVDERWGVSLGERQHGPDTLHDIRSITKSIVSLLYGIALEEEKVPALDESLLAQFPEYADLDGDPLRNEMTVRDALSMTMGIEWNENLPYTDTNNSEVAMEYADDRYRFVLQQSMVSKPGERWVYNGGAVALVGRLIAKGVGMPIEAYAKQYLFEPLGITNVDWIQGEDGVASSASGLRLTLPDLLKVGLLVNNRGKAGADQIVPQAWLDAALAPHVDVEPEGLRYGYLVGPE